MRGSLVDLERALKGLAAMSTDLEAMSVSLLTDQVMFAAFLLFRANLALLAPVQAKLLTCAQKPVNQLVTINDKKCPVPFASPLFL